MKKDAVQVQVSDNPKSNAEALFLGLIQPFLELKADKCGAAAAKQVVLDLVYVMARDYALRHGDMDILDMHQVIHDVYDDLFGIFKESEGCDLAGFHEVEGKAS
ncbi:hypothetical protein [Acinetobacter indicus]|uniref:hypothetical protein n=1 Tax=Acinetobacter indicus TaxID=756892 RepID=UPI00209AEAC8|nr:hypothetical protein [Acinetobacter indicus]MCO8088200.1 hypothetical protein [Acinetobacter indicus]